MKKVSIVLSILILVAFTSTMSYGGWGKEKWYDDVLLRACSVSGFGELEVGGSVGPDTISFTGGAGGGGSVVYAHYAGEVKKCEGWSGRCSGAGTERITNFTPISPCHL